MNDTINLFVDMDGTTAMFYENANCLEAMLAPGFFSNLRPYANVVEALKILARYNSGEAVKCVSGRKGVSLFSLSVPPEGNYWQAQTEKTDWNLRHLPGVFEDMLFPHVQNKKSEFVELRNGRKLQATDFLLDDYNKNLGEWRAAGGTAIKLVNDINDTGKFGMLWDGPRVRYDWPPERIAEAIATILNLK